MKTKLLTFYFFICVCIVSAQMPYIGTYTMIPQNPTPADFIKVVTHVTTPNQGIVVDLSHTVVAQQIKIKGCYWQGFATAIQTHIDTFMIGQLPAGNYQVIQQAYMSTTQQWCNKTDSNMVVSNIAVAVGTDIQKTHAFDRSIVHPNPAATIVYISIKSPIAEVDIYSSDGRLVTSTITRENGAIDIHDLPVGLYFARIVDDNKVTIYKFVKTEVN